MDLNFKTLEDILIANNSYMIQAFIVVFGSLIIDYIQRRILKRLQKRLEETENRWDDALIAAVRRPLSVIIWAAGISLAAEIIQKSTKAVIFSAVQPVRDTVIIAALAWFLVRLINNIENTYIEKEKDVDHTTIDAFSKLLRISVFITAALVVLQTLGYSVSGVLAFGGIGGIAIGFAAKDLLANFFGGLTIYLDRPFAVGEWVRSPDREIEGTVEKIGWRLTCIRTFDKRPLYVPNSIFTTIAVENPSRMKNRRIYETIGIRYEDAAKIPSIIQNVKEMLQNHSEIDSQQTLIVNFNSFAPSSLDFFIYTFTKTTNWVHFHEVKQEILLRVIKIIEGQGAEIAFPTSTIHLAKPLENEMLSPPQRKK
ncbi:MAG: mechanosensitive ion channel family protein [Nitrospinae bacterium]|nr:mechanosensitive ion channel family protein [Nitrospinota bacterium]MDA1108591.1 mechanosensitive ion channel family protein [Nitrospinota bacterium]